jgi:flagellar hook assembly protein FlgD
MTFDVNFAPTQQMEYNGELTITSDDPFAPITIIPLHGVGGIVANDDLVNPVVTALHGNYPNPFNPTTTISYSVREKQPVQLVIYNMLGQKVKTLVNGEVEPGNHSAVWHGRDNNGRPVASGVYFFKMHAGKYTSTKKMILMK